MYFKIKASLPYLRRRSKEYIQNIDFIRSISAGQRKWMMSLSRRKWLLFWKILLPVLIYQICCFMVHPVRSGLFGSMQETVAQLVILQVLERLQQFLLPPVSCSVIFIKIVYWNWMHLINVVLMWFDTKWKILRSWQLVPFDRSKWIFNTFNRVNINKQTKRIWIQLNHGILLLLQR